MYPFQKVKKFEFWRAPFGKTFFSDLLTLKILCVQHEWLKSLNFKGSVWGKPPFFVTFSLILISTHLKNLIHLALTV